MDTKKIGVWGLGVVGKSVVTFLQKQAHTPIVYVQTYSQEDREFLTEHRIPYITENITEFLETIDMIIPSPGIDLRPYHQHAHKWLPEVDIFQQHTTTPCIAITGTLGKTSITHLLGQVLTTTHKKVYLGGNIGTGMLDLLCKPPADYHVLELSSFQLEHAKIFAPSIAVITNIYPNHLDRHGTLIEYQKAKFNILAHQHAQQHALLPLELYAYATTKFPQRTFSFFSLTANSVAGNRTQLSNNHNYYYIDNNHIVKQTHTGVITLLPLTQLPPLSFRENWLIVTSILDMLSCTPAQSIVPHASYYLPQHRIDAPIIYNGIAFYNDSKSTLMQATIAAVVKMPTMPILLLGGLSKGVDRIPYLPLLKEHSKMLICFGKEAQQLAHAAQSIDLPACAHATLDEAFVAALACAQKGDCILLSPGGSSYDLFANYQERGSYFEELVKKYGAQKC